MHGGRLTYSNELCRLGILNKCNELDIGTLLFVYMTCPAHSYNKKIKYVIDIFLCITFDESSLEDKQLILKCKVIILLKHQK